MFFPLQRIELNLPPLQEKARLQDDIKAIKTIGITIAAYFLCYVPAIVYAVVGLQKENLTDSWFAFIAWYSLYISSALNPIIYYLRARRCRSAFKEFLKDPFGSSDFKENSEGRGKGGNPRDEVMKRIRNGERGREVPNESDSTQNQGGRRDAIVLKLNLNLSSHHKVGPGSGNDGEKGKNGGEACASNSPGKVLDTEEVSDEVLKKCGLKKESVKPQLSSSRKKVEPLEVGDMDKTGEPNCRKREPYRHCTKSKIEFQGPSQGNQRNMRKFEKAVPAAWVTKE